MFTFLNSRMPWIAVCLSLLFPGLGHAYCGFWVVGVAWFASLYALLLAFSLFFSIESLWAFYTVFFVHGLFYVLIIVDALRRAIKAKGRRVNHLKLLPAYVALAVVIWAGENYYLHHRSELLGVENYRLASNSMTPYLQEGDYVVVDSRIESRHNLAVGDVVVFKLAGKENAFVKRVAALPHETIEIRGGKVYRNKVFEPELEVLALRRRRLGSQSMDVMEVPAGEVFLLGDWRDNSKDSRSFGPVPIEDVTGQVMGVWFSPDFHRIGMLKKPIIIQE